MSFMLKIYQESSLLIFHNFYMLSNIMCDSLDCPLLIFLKLLEVPGCEKFCTISCYLEVLQLLLDVVI